ncbi:MAG: DMT family transporter [Anaerolineales bacterium]|nr:DMT family transporter [Anaerolineales bacterium]MCB9128507.1 DMT family transporter [Ardenticatenales bacterium]
MSRWQADLMLLVVVIIWGSTFITVKNALDWVGPFTFVAIRFWIAGGVLVLLWLLSRQPSSWPLWRHGLLAGLLLSGGYITQTIGLQSTSASKAGFITGMAVVIVPILAALLLRDPIGRAVKVGILLAVLGLALMTLRWPLERLTTGDLWVLACAFFFAIHIISIAHYAPRHSVLPFATIQLLTAALVASLMAWQMEANALVPPAVAYGALLFMGLVATALAFGLQVMAQRHTTATHAALLFALEPVFAALFAMGIGGEAMGGREWLGGALILAGMLGAELAPLLRRP